MRSKRVRLATLWLILVLVLAALAASGSAQDPLVEDQGPDTTGLPVAGVGQIEPESSVPAGIEGNLLWNQPMDALSSAMVNYDALIYDQFDAFLADDFANDRLWSIDTIFVPSHTASDGCDLTCADWLHWEIYADAGGKPAGDPAGGGSLPIWWLSLPPDDPAVYLSAGLGGWLSDVTLTLPTPITLGPGTWWLVYYPTIDSDACGCVGYRFASDTTNGHAAQVMAPAGGWGLPSTWTSIQDPNYWNRPEQDLAFGLWGTTALELGGRAWYDTDQDGIQGIYEPGIKDTRLYLYEGPECGLDLPLDDAVTDQDGVYVFEDLFAGDYCIATRPLPDRWYLTSANQGGDDGLDSDMDPVGGDIPNIHLTADDLHEGIGMYALGIFTGTVFCDEDLDYQYDAGEERPGVTVGLYENRDCDDSYDDWIVDAETQAGGDYTLDGVPAGPAQWGLCYTVAVDVDDMGDCDQALAGLATWRFILDTEDLEQSRDFLFQETYDLGGRVWYDTAADGIQQPGEPGVAGLGVDLFALACTGLPQSSTTTAPDGSYRFSDLPWSTYCLQFEEIPAGWRVSPQDQGGDDSVDSDVDPATGQIVTVLVADDLTQDMGTYARGTIGDTVWCDGDGNGKFDAGEGVKDVTVTLGHDPDCDGIAAGTDTQETTGDGQYLFNGLPIAPPGSRTCYLMGVDLNDLGECRGPITPTRYIAGLRSTAPEILTVDFGFRKALRVYLPLVVQAYPAPQP